MIEKKTLDVSIIICVYTEERWNDIVMAVESLHTQSQLPCEIIVVVDHNPELFKRVKEEIPGIISVENREPHGLSGARNSGIALAHGRYIGFLDDDAVAAPDWLELLVKGFEDPQVLGVGGIVEPWWLGEQPAWFPKEFYWVVGCTYQKLAGVPIKVRNPFGGCSCLRRELFEVVGGFRNGIGRVGTRPVGCEETELAIRATQKWPQQYFLCEPRASIRHRITSSRASWRYFRSRCYAEGLSKALIARYVGAKDSLASERTYTLRTLPLGVLRGLQDGLFRLDGAGFLRAGAIIGGLVLTMAGYLVGRMSQRTISLNNVEIIPYPQLPADISSERLEVGQP